MLQCSVAWTRTWSSLSFLLPQLQSMPLPWGGGPHQSTAGQSINYRRQFISNKASPLWRLSNTTSNCFITIIGKHLLRQHAEIRRNFEFATRAAHAQQQQQLGQGQGDTHLAVARRTYLVLRSSYPELQPELEEVPELGHELESYARSHRWNFENST